ncbi:MAG TPA: hypothetical protein VNY36_07685, partial [Bacteroidia bacterium]|nr:hypothetical protein [Bacteroidia bacterium]
MKAKKLLIVTVLSVLFFSCQVYVHVIPSEPDATIFVDNKKIATGDYNVQINQNECATVRVEKDGFIPYEIKYCNQVKGYQVPPARDNVVLAKDESFDASAQNDNANQFFKVEVDKKYNEDAAWKIINQIVLEYYDEIVTNIKESGYLVTSWKVQSFNERTIRTRIITKTISTSPLTYGIKICS